MKDIISKRRKELGLTQQELADKLYVSDKVISKWETGKSIPDTSLLVDLSNILEISLDELLNSGKEVSQENIKLAIADHAKIKYNNVLIITITLAIVSLLLFFVAKIVDYNAYQNKYEILILILYILSSIVFIGSIGFFFIARNKIFMDFPRCKDTDKPRVKTIIISYGFIVFTSTLVMACTHGLEVFEIFIILLIAGFSETLVFILIYYLYKKITNQ